MNPRIGVPLIVALLLASSWAFSNEETLNDWVRANQFSVESEESELLGLQTNETWLVLVADFSNQRANEAWGPNQAQFMLDDVADSYVHQLSNNESNLVVVVHPEVTTAQDSVEAYGMDTNGNRDTDASGTFLPTNLAEEVVLDHADEVNWSRFDLNGDGEIDRLLILHTTKGQEEEPAQTNKIWSHFTHFESPLTVGEGYTVGHYTMASLRTGSSGMGTVLHEMMHQMGALDLYPVHETSINSNWHGVGNWDIMASGNWNGGGVWPALPTAASMELIGAERITTMDLDWPATSAAPCIGPNVTMQGMSDGGMALKVPMNEHQSVFIERHTNHGFDVHLPGQGVLVTIQDRSVGDLERNELNRDPEQPWLAVVEADGRNDMRNGVNDGEASDMFTNGTKFGAEGVQIRNHDGFLVPWVAIVFGEANMSIQFTAPNCTPKIAADGPNHGAVLLPNQPLMLEIEVAEPCTLTHTLNVTDGRTIGLTPGVLSVGRQSVAVEFGWNGTPNSESILEGTIQCGTELLDLSTTVLTLARIPVEATVIGTMPAFSQSMLNIPIESAGDGTQSFTVDLDGPMSRVATIEDRITLQGEDSVVLNINPNGLLEQGMRVHGELVLIDTNGHRWMYELDYTAQTEATTLDEWRTPGRILGIVCMIGVLWVLLGLVENKKQTTEHAPSNDSTVTPQNGDVTPQESTDPWGRPVDDFE